MKSLEKDRGFTLMEMVLAVLLISILLAMSFAILNDNTDSSRYDDTRTRMDEIVAAMFGDKILDSAGHRVNFGYAGDWGSLPATLTNLTTSQAPAWSYDHTHFFGSGWKGPYLQTPVTGLNPLADAWGNAFTYNSGLSPATLTSLGADGAVGGTLYNTDLTASLATTLWQSTVYGSVLAQNAGVSGATVQIWYPSNGAVTSSTATTDANGGFSFSNVPMGVRSIAETAPFSTGIKQIVVDTPQYIVPSDTLTQPGFVTAGLIMLLDANEPNANGAPGAGCAPATWNDISGLGNNATLQNFSACGAASGWNGSGVPTDPYRLTFQGTGPNYVTPPDNLMTAYTAWTIQLWFQTGATGGLVGNQTNAYPTVPNPHWDPVIYIDSAGKIRGGYWIGSQPAFTSATAVTDGNWHFAAWTGNASSQAMYLDGALINSVGSAGEGPFAFSTIGIDYTASWTSGNGGWLPFTGNIAEVSYYDVALTAAQIYQNCLAMQPRFSTAVCN